MKQDVKEILLKVKQAFKNNNTEVIEQLTDILDQGKSKEEFFKNYPELLEVYETVGDNPLESPKLYVAEVDFVLGEYVDIVQAGLELDLENYPLEDALNFAGMVWTKVNSFRDSSGHIKSTKNTENAKMPTTKNLNKFSKIELEKREAFQQTQAGFDVDLDDFTEYADELKNLEGHYEEKLLEVVIEITGVDAEALSDWEKKLLVADVKAYTKDSIARGKTSFKGYL